LLEAERAARGELDAKTQAQIELVNYVDALDLIDRRYEAGQLEITPEFIKDVHYETTKGLGADEAAFKPHHEGEWRDGEAKVVDHLTQTVLHDGAPQPEVAARMAGLCDWIADKEKDLGHTPPFVIAGVAHYVLTDVHPFADGNGRVGRLLTVALLERFDVMPGRLFNFEEYYGRDTTAYYGALRTARDTLNDEPWLEYFLEGLALEYERVATKVSELEDIGKLPRGGRAQLKASQETGLTAFRLRGVSEFSRADYEAEAGVSRNTALRDLGDLVDHGVLRPIGDGRARRYRFASATTPNPWAGRGGGRPVSWTDDRIRRELAELAGNSEHFPSRAAFEAAGKLGLYQAIHRHGGTTHWARQLDLEPPRRGGRRD
jgi:Fic family protein